MNKNYGAGDIQVLEGLEAVRKRPGMYIGSTSSKGLHHLVYEIVDNAVDEALAGYCDNIDVKLNKDGSVTVRDNGRGIPTDIHPTQHIPAVEVVFTILHAGGKFGGGGYKVSGGLHGVGSSVVNALSKKLIVTVYNENINKMVFERGNTVSPLSIVGKNTSPTGTEVTFYPDEEIFEVVDFHYEVLAERFREMAFLTKGLRINIECEITGKKDSFYYEGGIKEFISWLNNGKDLLYNEIVYCEGEKDGVNVEVSFQHNKGYSECIYSFVNNITTPEGGTHLSGFKTAITKSINDYARKNKLLKDKEDNLSGEDFREGITAIVSIKIEDPQFEGQTKQKLGNAIAKGAVESIFSKKLEIFLEQNPQVATIIVDKAILARTARENARKAKENTRRKSSLDSTSLPGKLADCSDKNADNCEIFIVEGDSAGGSAKLARNRENQAILPLRGKILNVQKKNLESCLKNEEIKSMITAFGTGIDEDFNIDNIRYDKIIIMTDADVDGSHITTLLLTFFYRFMPKLIETGHVYLAQPPLYMVEKNKKTYYAYDDLQLDKILSEIGRDSNNKIQRYKGLGEMDADQLWETTMDPNKRVLLKVSMDMENRLDINKTFETLMGEEVAPRKKFIEERAKFVRNLDI